MSALIIAFILYIIFTPANVILTTTESSNFEEIAQNFERESAAFLNYLIEHKQPVYDAFLNFTLLFTSYSKTKNPDFGLIYVFAQEGDLYLGNYAQDRVTFMVGSQLVTIDGCLDSVKTSFSVAGLQMDIPQVNVLNYKHCLEKVMLPAGFDEAVGMKLEELDTGMITQFTVEVTPSHPDLVILSKEKKGNVRRVYTKGKFI